MKEQTKSKLAFLAVMCFFGCLGPVVKAIGLPSPVTACLRAWVAALSLIFYIVITKKKFSSEVIRKKLLPLIICGILMAGDWIFFFESYNFTTVATATVCYYIAPIFVIIGSVFLLREKLTLKSSLCIITAFIGMAMSSGIVENGIPGLDELKGVLSATLGAVFYAGIIIMNKKFLSDVDPILRTTTQLFIAAVVTTPYVQTTYNFANLSMSFKSVLWLLFLGVCMTAVTYIVYFTNIVKIESKTVAIFSYGDPTVAVIVSAVFMHEPITIFGILGAVLVIGSAIVSEIK